MNATLVSNPQNHNKKKICHLYNIDSWNSYEWLCWRSLWKWYFTLHSMNYSGPSWAFLQESKVSCSRAKPTRSSFSFLWIHWRQQICRAQHDGQRAKSDCGCRWQWKWVSTDHVYRSNLIGSCHGSNGFPSRAKLHLPSMIGCHPCPPSSAPQKLPILSPTTGLDPCSSRFILIRPLFGCPNVSLGSCTWGGNEEKLV